MAITPSSVSFWLARLQEIGVACDLKGKICVDFGTDDIIRAIKNLKEEAIEEDMDTDKKYIEDIKKMTLEEVMKEILDNPEYLTDSWYREFGNALMDRGNELLEKKS
jgi:enoyl reductase-like protein